MIQISDLERSLQQVAATGQVAASAPVTQTEQPAAAAENAASEVKMRYHTDRVEISAQAYTKAAQSASVQSETTQDAAAQSVSAKRAPASQPPSAAQAEEAEQEQETAAVTATATPTAEAQALDSAKRTIEQLSSEEETDAADAAEQAASSGTTALTSLSEQQLEDLVSAGTITRAEADTEMARRQKQQPEEQPASDVQSMAAAQAMAD